MAAAAGALERSIHFRKEKGMKRKKLSLAARLILLELVLLIALVAFLLGGYMIVEV